MPELKEDGFGHEDSDLVRLDEPGRQSERAEQLRALGFRTRGSFSEWATIAAP